MAISLVLIQVYPSLENPVVGKVRQFSFGLVENHPYQDRSYTAQSHLGISLFAKHTIFNKLLSKNANATIVKQNLCLWNCLHLRFIDQGRQYTMNRHHNNRGEKPAESQIGPDGLRDKCSDTHG